MVALPDRPQQTVDAIYASYEANQGDGYRPHLGGSAIGKECERALWYTFRWATQRGFDGRKLRLFDTGHRAEPRFIAELRRIGITVIDIDPGTGRQIAVKDETGHAGGSLDGEALGILEAPKTWHLLEFKTHNADNFAKLKKEGVRAAFPVHAAQMQFYMHLRGLTRAFYLAVNKNTDELFSERLEADPAEGARLVEKARRIINRPRPPEGISKNPQWYECKMCDHHAVCHEGARPAQHCRSCLHSTPAAGGVWTCAKHGGEIPPEFLPQGCEDHLYLPDFIAGEPIAVNEEIGFIQYRLNDGTTFTDGIPF